MAAESPAPRHAVSVVIPTVGRADVGAAIGSVRAQSGVDTQTVVVVDAEQVDDDLRRRLAGADVVLLTGARRGGSAARNLGVSAADGDLVAFLDDDDEFAPGKLQRQATELATLPDHAVVSGRVRWRRAGESRLSEATPSRLITPHERPEDYLFRGRRPGLDRPLLQTSTLMVRRRLALDCRWDEGLPRHQDWDWLIRLAREHRSPIHQLPDVVAVCALGSPGSISASPDWRQSATWARSVGPTWAPETYADFLVAQTTRYALQGRQWRAATGLLVEALRCGAPGAGPLGMAAAGLLPRATLERMALRRSGGG